MLKTQCESGYGFSGYCGGLKALAQNLHLKQCHFRVRATKHGVLHVGGAYTKTEVTKHQYCPKNFVCPIALTAVNGGATSVAVFVTEPGSKNGCPNAAMVGDYNDLMKYLSIYMSRADHAGVYYYHYMAGDKATPSKCFVDLDFYLPGKEITLSQPKVDTVIDTINTALNSDVQEKDTELAMVGSIRVCTPGKHMGMYKHSFHITWKNHVFASMEEHKIFMKVAFEDVKEDMYDAAVYTNGRCFRAPFSPKGGDETTILWPIDRVYFDGKWEYTFKHNEMFDPTLFTIMDIVPRSPIDTYTVHTVETKSNVPRVVQAIAAPLTTLDDHACYTRGQSMLDFFTPLMPVLIDKIQQNRRQLLLHFHGSDSRAGVPVGDALTFAAPVFTGVEGKWRVKVDGDTFCMHDFPNHYHSTGDKVCLSIDFVNGYYVQLCYACHATGDDLKKFSLFDDTGIFVHPWDDQMSSPILDIQGKHGAILFLQSLTGNVIYHPTFGATIYVYEPQTKLWLNNNEAIQVLTKYKNTYRRQYNDYCKNAAYKKVQYALSMCDTEKKKGAIRSNYKALCTRDPNKDLQG